MTVKPMRIFATALVISCTAGCAAFDPNNLIGRHVDRDNAHVPVPSPSIGPLSPAQRQQAFDFVWETINLRYYDAKMNGVDWNEVRRRYLPRALAAAKDEVFWEELDRMAGELQDSHTRVESPRRAELRKRNESESLGLGMVLIDNELVVSGVNSNSDAWWAGIRPGMTVKSIDGVAAQAAYEKLHAETRKSSSPRARHLAAIGRLNRGAIESSNTLAILREDGSEIAATLKRSRLAAPPSAAARRLPSGFGYVRFSNFTSVLNDAVIKGLRDHKEAPGLIIDLRGNGGGSLAMTRDLLNYIFQKRTVLTRQLTRDGKPISVGWGSVELIKLRYETTPRADAYTGPVVVLVNEGSGSASEYFAGTLQALGRATIVGRTTCGCLLAFLGYATVPGGGEMAYSEVGFVTATGKRIEGDGVVPDWQIPLTKRDLQLGRDRALEAAEEVLRAEVIKQGVDGKPPAPKS